MIINAPKHRILAGISIAVFFFLALTGCTKFKYHELQPATQPINGLTYYRWEQSAFTAENGARALEFDSAFRTTVEKGLEKKGYIYSADKPDVLLDYRITVITSPGRDESVYGPNWVFDQNGYLSFDGWLEPQGTGEMWEHGAVTLSLRSTQNNKLLWEGGVSKLLEDGSDGIDLTTTAQSAAEALLRKIPSH
jgi:hypothetical protein